MIPFSDMIVKANLCFFVILLKCNMGVILEGEKGIEGGRRGEIICGLFCDKRLIPCFRRCDILASMPHSKNTPSSRFSSKYPRKSMGDGIGVRFW